MNPPSSPDERAHPRRRLRDRKQTILNVARDLFVEQGFPSVTMAMIADQVGITAGALYRHFANKAELLVAVVEESFAWLDEPVVTSEPAHAIDALIERVTAHPYLSDLWLHEVRHLDDESFERLRGRMLGWQAATRPVLAEIRDDLDEGQSDLLSWAMISALSCLSRRSLHGPDALKLGAVRSALDAIPHTSVLATGASAPADLVHLKPVSMRERLLLAAFEQFGIRGYYDTSMADIAASAGVTGPNLYGYFESKADILRAVHERSIHALWLGLDSALSTNRSTESLLEEVVRSYVALARTWASTVDDPAGRDGFGEHLRAVQREYVDEWVALLTAEVSTLDARVARVRVQIALAVVADLYRIPRLTVRTSFQDNLVAVVLAILRSG